MQPLRLLAGFQEHELAAGCRLWVGHLPEQLVTTEKSFNELWSLHPEGYHEIKIHGRLVKTPRWQQAYGRDYHYTGRVNKAFPVPSILEPFLRWGQKAISTNLNGMLLNWYDGSLGHYIGPHRDSTKNMVAGSPIVTISLGEERTFRLRPWSAERKTATVDFPAQHGTVFVMPWETNLSFTHEIPKTSRAAGRRVSITLRAFGD